MPIVLSMTGDESNPMKRKAGAKRVTPPVILSSEWLSELRHRVRDNVYGSPDFVDALARRLLRSGDL